MPTDQLVRERSCNVKKSPSAPLISSMVEKPVLASHGHMQVTRYAFIMMARLTLDLCGRCASAQDQFEEAIDEGRACIGCATDQDTAQQCQSYRLPRLQLDPGCRSDSVGCITQSSFGFRHSQRLRRVAIHSKLNVSRRDNTPVNNAAIAGSVKVRA